MNLFQLCSIQPGALPSPSLAIAAARAGACALLDLERLSRSPAVCLANLQRLLSQTPPAALLGLRILAADIALAAPLLKLLEGRPHYVILAAWTPESVAHLAAPGRLLWLEITGPDQLELAPPDASFHGWLGRGSECGGIHGNSSIFVLAQHLSRQSRPFLLQGGLGIQSSVACRVAGAAGVIFDDQLLLMPESPLPGEWKEILRRSGSEDTATLSVDSETRGIRFLNRPETPIARQLLATAGVDWESLLTWGPPSDAAWPVGQGIGFARSYAERYRTTGRFLGAVAAAVSDAALDRISSADILTRNGPLAKSHGTEFPIVQGPMTRVSDRAEFAAAVAESGALPMIALALLRQEEAFELLSATKALLADRPWGVGILGFVPQEIRAGQLAAIREIRPPFALIAGGRVDQSAQLEEFGIPTYLHVPSASILKIFLGQGARRFVFEGSECGGHTGPLPSFPLWQQVIDVLQTEVPAKEAAKVHLLFAGGIHDALSAATVSAMSATLAEQGMNIGVLIGTGYLFTREAVECGAIVEQFQQTALASSNTVKLETGVGHYIRCAPTPFTAEFHQTRLALQRQGLPPAEISKALDALTIGRARTASKGLHREGAQLLEVAGAEQQRMGMYMMGEAAALRNTIVTMRDLHQDLIDGATELLADLAAQARPATDLPVSVPIAIVGAASFVPHAQDVDRFWRNLLDKDYVVTEIPQRRFDWRMFFDADPNAPDKIYSKWGGFLEELHFDPVRYGIPPKSLKAIATSQLFALEASRRAFEDAGYAAGDFDRENTAVIFGHSSTADLHHHYISRGTTPLVFPSIERDSLDRMPEWSEETFPGLLMNVTAGRVANRFDLGGPNFTVDAACASSLAALELGMRELETGRSNVALVAGVDLENSSFSYLCFSKTKALSKTGKPKPFDRNADGIVISEGVVALVLKRLTDAERDGDRIYAVIKSVEGSSDGKALGLTAPRSAGQRRALARAYSRAGFSPATIGMYEAHGTGTAVGDRAELETIDSALAASGAGNRSCVLGSAKSLLGHTKSAAGMVGTLKAALALYHKTLPPHGGVEQPLDRLQSPDVRLRLIDQAEPWLESDTPRRAGVSAFGFGGTNFHAVLEEYRGHLQEPPLGGDAWPAELFAFAAPNEAALERQLEQWQQALSTGPARPLRDLSFTALQAAEGNSGPCRLGFVAADHDELARHLATSKTLLSGEQQASPGIFLNRRSPGPITAAAIGFLFPGQGSQYPGMGRELSVYLPEFRRALDDASQHIPASLFRALRDGILPPPCYDKETKEHQRHALAATEVAQPALGTISAAMFDLACRLGLEPGAVAGHSYGEYAALHAAQVFDRSSLFKLSAARGLAMSKAADAAPGSMAAVHVSREELRGLLNGSQGLTIANHNSQKQCVISGDKAAVESAMEKLTAKSVRVTRLPVGSAFHSPLMASASQELRRAIDTVPVSSPTLPVYANYDGTPYAPEPAAIREQLGAHLEAPVEFVAQILGMYEAGVRVFVELGPRNTLTGLADTILEGLPHLAVSFDGQGGGIRGLLHSLAALHAANVQLQPLRLFDGRRVTKADLAAVRPPEPEWLIDGGGVRHRSEPLASIGSLPAFTLETAAEAAAVSRATTAADAPLTESLSAYQEYQETMRRFLATQEQVLMQLLDRTGGGRMVPAPQPPQLQAAAPPLAIDLPPAAPAEAPKTFEVNSESITSLLTNLVSERTGYSAEMFRADQDLEAELGVDSIKRIEILSGLEARLPAALGARFRERMDQLMQVKTVQNLAAEIIALHRSVAPASASPDLPRYIMQPVPAALGGAPRIPVAGLFLITEDRLGVSAIVANLLERQGAKTIVLSRDLLGSVSDLSAKLKETRFAGSPFQGIVHLAPLHRQTSGISLEAWRAEAAIQTKSLFDILRHHLPELTGSMGPRKVALAATLFGGVWGRHAAGESAGWAVGGGTHGILRSLSEELPHVTSKTVDLDPATPLEDMAANLVAELLTDDGDVEIGYPQGRRVVFRPALQPCDPQTPERAWKPDSGWVVLVTGGGRGITSHIVSEMAAPGVRFIVVGSSPDVEDPEEDTSAEAAARLRKQQIEVARQSGIPVSPARIDREIRAVLSNRERSNSLRALRNTGAWVEYRQADVRNASEFGALIEGLYVRFGRIDAVVHGAGIIEDKLLQSKPREVFDRVFDTKSDSAYLLLRHLRPDGLRWVALFSSVSSRFGNRGQTDYAAANEVLTRTAWEMARRWPSTRVVSFVWGPWTMGGMISEGVGKLLEERGFKLIDRDSGCRFFAAELARGARDQVEIVAGEGPWGTAAPRPRAPELAIEAAAARS